MKTIFGNGVRVFAVALLVAVLAGCMAAGSGGSSLARVSLDVEATGVTTAVAASNVASIAVTNDSGTQVGTFDVDTAIIALEYLDFEQENEDGSETENEFDGPFIVDLVAGTIEPQIDTAQVPPGSYNSISIGLYRAGVDELDDDQTSPVDSSAAIYGYSMIVKGSFTATGQSTGRSIELRFTEGAWLDVAAGSSANALQLDAGESNPVIVAFRSARWFAGLNELATYIAAQSGTDPIVVDGATVASGSTEAGLLDAMLRKIESSADFGEDTNGDGDLDSDEDDDDDADDANDSA